VRTASNGDDQRATADQLQRVVRTFDLMRFQFTSTVVIDATAIPHSHPVLTLRIGYPSDDALLSEFPARTARNR
jgi:hypothetical protein